MSYYFLGCFNFYPTKNVYHVCILDDCRARLYKTSFLAIRAGYNNHASEVC
uniref:Uncharacterized protein n=1 Tax=Arundo donax TaxID=35708 RepID=A0A0A9GEE4_ARUDO